MPVYMIIEAKEISNQKLYAEYIRAVPRTVEQFGGKYLVRGGEVTVMTGDWNPARLVIIEFPSMDRYRSWLRSPEYRTIAGLRECSAKTNAIVVPGCESV